MKITEVIRKLEECLDVAGDVEVVLPQAEGEPTEEHCWLAEITAVELSDDGDKPQVEIY
jgi:hypothetical protein